MTGLAHGTWWERHQGDDPGTLMEGRFMRLFEPGDCSNGTALEKLANSMTAEPEHPPAPEGTPDAEENPGIEAGYTYLGQFIDHDITFDPTSHLREKLTDEQLRTLPDFRTPRLDLDCLYGRGPDDQ